MTDMIAGEDVPCSDRNFSKVGNLRPTDEEEDPSNQPAAEMREHSLCDVLSKHVSCYWFTKTTREPQAPIGIDSSGANPKTIQ